MEPRVIDRAAEARRLMELASDPRFDRVISTVERQFMLLHSRGHVQLALCGILITASSLVTRMTAEAGASVQILMLMGSLLALAASVVVVAGVLRLRWLSRHPGHTLEEWLATALEFRDKKTRAYHLSTGILFGSLLCYQASIALVLVAAAT